MQQVGPPASLVGRDAELLLVDGLLERACGEGRGEGLILHGEPGVGKSSVAAEAARGARERGATVLSTTAVPCESELPFSALHQLLWPVVDHVEDLPAPQREALKGALGAGDAARTDPYRAGLAVLGLLGDLAEQAPLLLLVEDAHWLDGATSDVLAFVARRLESDAIAVLVTSREGLPRSLSGAGFGSHTMQPLDDAAAAALLEARFPELAPTARRAILGQAAGNPLALVELPAERGRTEDSAMPTWVPLTTRLERTFLERAASLPPKTHRALVVAALSDRTGLERILPAATRVAGEPVSLEDLLPAAAAGLAELDEGRLVFQHPLMRSAIRENTPDDQRRAAHAALADVFTDDPARELEHRVAATDGTDDALADRLAALAQTAARRGSVVRATNTISRAARLTTGDVPRAARLLDAADLALEIGRGDLVDQLLRDLAPLQVDGPSAARRAWLESTNRLQAPSADWIAALLDRAEQIGAAGDVVRAAQTLQTVAFRCWWSAVPQPARDRVTDLSTTLLPSDVNVDATQTVILTLVDSARFAGELSERLAQFDASGARPDEVRLAAVAATILGDFERGAALADGALAQLRARQRYGTLAPPLVGRAWAGVFLGEWTPALALAEEAVRVSMETDQPLWAVSASAAAATLTGLRGDHERAMQLADRAARVLPAGAADGMHAVIDLARGLAELAADRPQHALDRLLKVTEPDLATGAHIDFVARWAVADLAEAAVRAGNPGAAQPAIARYAAAGSRSQHLEGSLAYAQLLVCSDGDLDARARQALAATSRFSLLRARTQLAYGARLRRAHRVTGATPALRAARDTFEALALGPLADRARQELRAAGETTLAPVMADAREILTPQELQIAELAAEGLTNREIGQQLYLSHRTVGSHLYRIFPKLGIAARHELEAAIGVLPRAA